MTTAVRGAIPSPNIWRSPDVYELENLAFRPPDAIETAMREIRDWTGATVADIGCGTGFHLPVFARTADRVIGIDPHPRLAALARRRVARQADQDGTRPAPPLLVRPPERSAERSAPRPDPRPGERPDPRPGERLDPRPGERLELRPAERLGPRPGGRTAVSAGAAGRIDVRVGVAQDLPLADASVEVAHARWAYFFGPGCEPGLAELGRVIRRGGAAFVVDTDAGRSTFGAWFRRGLPAYDPVAVERFWSRQGFERRRLDLRWSFDRRADLEAVLRIEFPAELAAELSASHAGLEVDYAVNLWWRRY
jgi:SAM-dependent methyltransferase